MTKIYSILAAVLMSASPALAHDPDAEHYAEGLSTGIAMGICAAAKAGQATQDWAQYMVREMYRDGRLDHDGYMFMVREYGQICT